MKPKVREVFEITLGAIYYPFWSGETLVASPSIHHNWLPTAIRQTKFKPGDRVRVTVERLPERKEASRSR